MALISDRSPQNAPQPRTHQLRYLPNLRACSQQPGEIEKLPSRNALTTQRIFKYLLIELLSLQTGLMDTAGEPARTKIRRPRAARACELCRLKKNKCNEGEPCSYCRSRLSISLYSYQDFIDIYTEVLTRAPQITMRSVSTGQRTNQDGWFIPLSWSPFSCPDRLE
jgi:hypothetical protein